MCLRSAEYWTCVSPCLEGVFPTASFSANIWTSGEYLDAMPRLRLKRQRRLDQSGSLQAAVAGGSSSLPELERRHSLRLLLVVGPHR